MSSWQSYTGEAAPRVVNMHGVRVVYMYEEGVTIVLPTNDLIFNLAFSIYYIIAICVCYWKVVLISQFLCLIICTCSTQGDS